MVTRLKDYLCPSAKGIEVPKDSYQGFGQEGENL